MVCYIMAGSQICVFAGNPALSAQSSVNVLSGNTMLTEHVEKRPLHFGRTSNLKT